MAESTPTKVAVIITDDPAPRWQVDALTHLGRLPSVEVQMILAVPALERRSSLATFLRDRWAQRQPAIDATRPTPLPSAMQPLVRRTNDPNAELATWNVDVVLCLAPQHQRPMHHDQEVWSYAGNTADPCIDALLNGTSMACLALVQSNDNVLIQACLPVTASTLSTRSERLLEAAATWPARVLAERKERGRSEVPAEPVPVPKTHRTAGNLAVLRFMLSDPFQRKERRPIMVEGEEWNVGVLYQPINSLLTDGNSVNVRWLPAPAEGSQRMQPFGYMDQEDRLTALYIKVNARDNKWSIARVRPKGDNVLKRSRLLMDLRPGTGYPFVVPSNDGPFVVIGSPEERSTVLYRSNQTGDALEPSCVLLDRAVCSPTLFQHEGRWWLMGTSIEEPDAELLAFHADQLEGPYTGHPGNALKLDLRSARPAGTPFVHDGQLYRPALDASIPDQPSIVILCIDLLTTERFVEHIARHVPNYHGTSYPHGIRTICAMGELTLVDGLRLSGNKAPQRPPSKRHRSSRKKRS